MKPPWPKLLCEERPPVWPLAVALLNGRDADIRVRIVDILTACSELDPVRIIFVLARATWDPHDPAIRQAATRSLLGLVARFPGPPAGLAASAEQPRSRQGMAHPQGDR